MPLHIVMVVVMMVVMVMVVVVCVVPVVVVWGRERGINGIHDRSIARARVDGVGTRRPAD